MKKIAIVPCIVSAVVLWLPLSVQAHGPIGKCFLPATLATDDPFVADELSLPTIAHIKTPASADSPATKETDISAEVSKRLSPTFRRHLQDPRSGRRDPQGIRQSGSGVISRSAWRPRFR